MKLIVVIFFPLILYSCNSSSGNSQLLEKRIDSLKTELNKLYKPGFGEFMSNIQIHHGKLWFAGINQNWKLADFEINELKENLNSIETYCIDRPETKNISMIYPSLDSVSNAITQNNLTNFKSSFNLLTKTCNSCHKAVNFEFNSIKIPTSPPFTNQEFK
jgi:hypothetical protein